MNSKRSLYHAASLGSVQTRRYSCAKSLLISHIKKQLTSSSYLSVATEITQDLQLFSSAKPPELPLHFPVIWFLLFVFLSDYTHPSLMPMIYSLSIVCISTTWCTTLCSKHVVYSSVSYRMHLFVNVLSKSSLSNNVLHIFIPLKKNKAGYSNQCQTIPLHPQAFGIQRSQSHG